ncbi:TonB-dependent siderophore receptor [Neisseria montereyensis]|uniref:TonB-dependent siderophore receptor n=1 Tax=Neisseria montereyensis TaxID=2973938 RepID=A0ABT2FB85_9NEIS|nr:TonB-dependent siderophore receptor [Neisseria montereyensis]MCS4533422.1 TonB-dependent siderophore receptor [Neisseria montereyensis]
MNYSQFSMKPLCLTLLMLGGVTSVYADDEPTVELESVTITAQRPSAWQSPPGVVAIRSATATKTDTRIDHTPASISVITRDQMRDQGDETVAQALRYTPGVYSESRTSTRYDSIFMRGFGGFGREANFVQYLDGQRLARGLSYLNPNVDPFLLERIDVVRGANSVQYGQISPGGMVNQISRRAHFTPGGEVEARLGNNQQRVLGFDVNQPLGPSGEEKVAVRLGGVYRYNESETDLKTKRYALAPSVTWKIGPKTELTAHAFWQRDPEGGEYNSLPALGTLIDNPAGNVPRHEFLGDRDFERYNRHYYTLGYRFSHSFNDNISFQHNLLYSKGRSSFRNTSLLAYLSGSNWSRTSTAADEHARGLSADMQWRFRFHTGSVQHSLNTGLDYFDTRSDRLLGNLRGAMVPPVDTSNPQPSNIPTPPWNSDSNHKQRQWGIYLQDQIEAGPWLAQLGLRHDKVRTRDTVDVLPARRRTTDTNLTDSKTTYQAGVMYRFASGVSPYLSYSTSFEPTVDANPFGDPFLPTTAKQWEAGLKYRPQGMRALFSGSAFDLTRDNVLTKDVRPGANPNARIQTGQVQVRGLELEARMDLNDRLSTIATGTWLRPKVSRTNIAEEAGKQPVGVPKTMASLWAQYAFLNQNLELAAGVRYVSSSYADVANTFKVPSKTLIDLGARYNLGHISPNLKGAVASLNVHNLTDKEHYGGCFSRGLEGNSTTTQCFPGSRRSVVLGLNYAW